MNNNNQNDFRPSEPYEYTYTQGAEPNFVPENQSRTTGLAITSLVLGILGLFCCCGALPFGIVSIVLSLVDRSQNKRFSGVAIGGLVCGIMAAIIGITILVSNLIIYSNPEFLEAYFSSMFDAYPTPYGG